MPESVFFVKTDTLDRHITGNDIFSLEGSTASFDHGSFDLEPEDVFIVDQLEKSKTEDNCLTTENLENNEAIEETSDKVIFVFWCFFFRYEKHLSGPSIYQLTPPRYGWLSEPKCHHSFRLFLDLNCHFVFRCIAN